MESWAKFQENSGIIWKMNHGINVSERSSQEKKNLEGIPWWNQSREGILMKLWNNFQRDPGENSGKNSRESSVTNHKRIVSTHRGGKSQKAFQQVRIKEWEGGRCRIGCGGPSEVQTRWSKKFVFVFEQYLNNMNNRVNVYQPKIVFGGSRALPARSGPTFRGRILAKISGVPQNFFADFFPEVFLLLLLMPLMEFLSQLLLRFLQKNFVETSQGLFRNFYRSFSKDIFQRLPWNFCSSFSWDSSWMVFP